jgi:hypothetical protein
MPAGRTAARPVWFPSLAALLFLLLPSVAQAGGPRWSSGPPYFTNQNGVSVVWYTNQPLYFTDPADLSATVNHAAADALVAAAAATWSVPTASVALAQGGSLDQHVSSQNMYLGSNGPVFPADVQASNGSAKQIAVIYDTDGSVTDTLLGGGASDPENCAQNAVTEDVDGISTAAQITHAVLLLNGRCTGTDPAMQMQMQYSLTRAFGRILGMAWSQANDNVFTGSSVATQGAMLHWPLMHPMEVFCGAYAYQCVVQPFTLKVDDVMTLQALYPATVGGGGKTVPSSTGAYLNGVLMFPIGQGMAGVNMVVRRDFLSSGVTDNFELASTVSGANFQQFGGNPLAAKGTDLPSSLGSQYASSGGYSFGYIPFLPSDNWVRLLITGEPINPLYTGPYAVGPYPSAQVNPSGTISFSVDAISTRVDTVNFVSASGASSCNPAADGTQAAPAAVPPTGWWSQTMCGYGHSAWSSLQVQADRSFTMEVTAVDEQGYATTGKLQPVIGVWASTDPLQAPPTVASQPSPLNSETLGMTTLNVSNATAQGLRIGLGDARGDGRPDYGYNARVLYADSIAPASLPANGGQVTITGMGFRQGNAVTMNGVAANVLSWTANTIVAVAPPITGPETVDVVVTDLVTGSQTTMTAALTYSGTSLPETLVVTSVPADGSVAGGVAALPFSVQVLLPDGVTPAVGGSVTVVSTNAILGGCGGLSGCVLTAAASGLATTTVTPLAAGTVTLGASLGSASVSASFTTMINSADQIRVLTLPSGTVYAGVPTATPFAVQVFLPDGVTPDAGAPVTVTASGASLGACGANSCVLTADSTGTVSTLITPAIAGTVALTAASRGGLLSASFGVAAMPADGIRLTASPANGAYVGQSSTLPLTAQVLLGDGVTPASGVMVTLTSTGATLDACGAASCVLTTNPSGNVSTTVTPSAAGTVVLTATVAGRSASAAFQAVARPPDVLRLASLPANSSYVGSATAQPFAVQLLLGDGVTPAAGINVALTASGALLGACGATQCVIATNAQGIASTTVIPAVSGVIQLTASAAGLSLSPSFTAISDAIHLVAIPSGYLYVGVPTPGNFTVQVTLADQITVVPGATVVVTASKAIVNACGLSTCIMTADATGSITTTLTPTQAGTISLQASSGGGTLQTSFAALAMPPDILEIVSKPAGLLYPYLVDATPIGIQVLLGDGRTPAPGVAVRLSSAGISLGPCAGVCNANHACGGACVAVADSNGMISVAVEGWTVGPAMFSATLGGAIVDLSFTVAVLPPSTLRIVSSPPDGSLVGRAAGVSFGVQLLRGDGVPLGGAATMLTAVGAAFGACGQASCTLTGDSSGTVSTSVTPLTAGTVHLTATAGGVTVTTTFLAVAAPPDTLRVLMAPANGSYAGRVAATPFQVQVLLANGSPVGTGIPVTLTASGATMGACGTSTCIVATDGSGQVATTVVPAVVGTVGLTASGGGGTISTSFAAAAPPPDLLTVLSVPANGSYRGLPAASPFAVQVKLSDGATVAAGVTVTMTAAGATLQCGLSICTLVADATGTVSTKVTPTSLGAIVLGAAAAGGSASATFNAVSLPTDSVVVLSLPANNSLINRAAALPFSVQILSITGTPVVAGISVSLTASGATFGGCGLATCSLRTDASGQVSTTVTPTQVGTVTLSAKAGGGSALASFTTVASLPDTLQVLSVPASGSYAAQVAAAPFSVKIALGDGTIAAGASVTLTAAGATLGRCAGVATCVLAADMSGTITTTVTPTGAGVVSLTAAAGGGSVTASFNAAAALPDLLRIVSVPASGSFVGIAAGTPFAVQILLADGVTPAVGARASVTVTGGVLGACGLATCPLTANVSGMISTTVTPATIGTVGLTAVAGGGSLATTFSAVAAPPDQLHVVLAPASGAYVGEVAANPFEAQVFLGDGMTPAAGVTVTLSVADGTLGSCALTTCALTADASGRVATSVVPTAAGLVTLMAAAGGGLVSTTFTAVDPVRVIASARAVEYVAAGSTVAWSPAVTVFENGLPAVGVGVVWTTSGSGFALGGTSSIVDAQGNASIDSTIGPLTTGQSVTAEACAWTNVCASLSAVAVDAAAWRLFVVSGGAQDVTTASELQPVTVEVVDTSGHPVAGVPVSVYQAVDGWVVCPAQGRCPSVPVLSTSMANLVSDADGLLSIAPLEMDGVAGVTQIVVSAGPYGAASASLSRSP